MRLPALVLAVSGLTATGALAEVQSELLFTHKAWSVSVVQFEDDSLGCLAEVADPGESFSIWSLGDGTVSLQFYSESWDFGEGQSANLQVEVDRRSPWTLNDANLSGSSVLFTLPDSDTGGRFVVEVARGNVLYLRTEDGKDVQSYSLAGSRAAIDALFQCDEILSDPSPKNPFN